MRTEKEVLRDISKLKDEFRKHKNNLAEKINAQANLFEQTSNPTGLFDISIDCSEVNMSRIFASYHNNIERLNNELKLIGSQCPAPKQISLF